MAKLILCFFIIIVLFVSLSTVGNGGEEPHKDMEAQDKKTSAPCSGISSYWDNVKKLMNQVQTYLFPPNLDFRSYRGSNEAEARVKEAVVKSKATMEDSAKSAGEVARETVQETAKKVKESLTESESESERGADPQAHAEL